MNPLQARLTPIQASLNESQPASGMGTVDIEPSAIGKFLNVLDYPAAVVRNTLAGEDIPTSPTRFRDRVSGRDVLASVFGAPENKQVGFSLKQIVDDPVETALDIAGFATEVVTDPLSYVGIGNLTRAGRAAKTAGTLPRGIFNQMKTLTPGGEVYRNAISFSNPLRLNPFADPQHSSKELTQAVGEFGSSTAGTINTALDSVPGIRNVRDSMSDAWRHLKRKSKMPGDPDIGRLEKASRKGKIRAERDAMKPVWTVLHKLTNDYGDDAVEKGMRVRELMETPSLLIDPMNGDQSLQIAVDQLSAIFDDSERMLQRVGALREGHTDVSALMSPEAWKKFADANNIDFTPGYVSRMEGLLAGGGHDQLGRIIMDGDPNKVDSFLRHRTDTYGHGWTGGIKDINDVWTDSELGDIARQYQAGTIEKADAILAIHEGIGRKYGDRVQREIHDRAANGKLMFRNLATGAIEEYTDKQVAGKAADAISNRNLKAGVSGKMPVFDKGKVSVKELGVDKAVQIPLNKLKPDADMLEAMATGKPFTHEGVRYVAQTVGETRTLIPYTTVNKKGEELAQLLAPVMRENDDRYSAVARAMLDPRNEEALARGVFPNDIVQDTMQYVMGVSNKYVVMQTTYDAMGVALNRPLTDPRTARTIESVLDDTMGAVVRNKDQAHKKIYQSWKKAQGVDIGDDMLRSLDMGDIAQELPLKTTMIDEDLAKDIGMLAPGIVDDGGGLFMNMLKGYGTFWKASVLTWPSRYVRDMSSAIVRNMEAGFFTSPWEGAKTLADAQLIYMGRGVESLRDLKPIQDELAQIGVNAAQATPKQLSDAFKVSFAKNRGMALNIRDELRGTAGFLDRGLDEMMPGQTFGEFMQSGKQSAASKERLRDRFGGRNAIAAMSSPSDMSGAMGGVFRIGDAVGEYTDTVTRMQAYLAQLRKGVSPEQAMDRLQDALLNYDPRLMSPFERNTMKTLLPFYSFFRNNLPWVAGQLMTRPGGRVAQIMKVYRSPEVEEDIYAPQWLRDSFAVPYQSPDGSVKMYASGFGLMSEDAIETLAGIHTLTVDPSRGIRTLANEGLSRLNPVPKFAVEWGTGVSTFQTTDEGGVQLKSADPPLGRLVSNIRERLTGKEYSPRDMFPQQELVEHALMAAPFWSRAVGAAKTITDTRPIPAGTRAVNLMTGMKVTSQDEEQQYRNAVTNVENIMRDYGSLTYDYNKLIVRKDELEKAPPEIQHLFEQLDNSKRMYEELKKKSREKSTEHVLGKLKKLKAN